MGAYFADGTFHTTCSESRKIDVLTMEPTEGPDGITDVAQKALQANKVHQYALKVYTERLEAELRTIDKLLVCFRTSSLKAEI